MDEKLRQLLNRLIESIPPGGTGGSLNLSDGDLNYTVSATCNGCQWQFWASSYTKPEVNQALPLELLRQQAEEEKR